MTVLRVAFTLWITLASAQFVSATPPDTAAYQKLAKQDLRLATVGYRLALANAPFCERKSRNPGWVLHDLVQYADPKTAQAAFNSRAPVAVSAIVLGGPADLSGIEVGDGILAINGKQLSELASASSKNKSERLEKVQNLLEEALDSKGDVEIVLATTNGKTLIRISPPMICASRFWVDTETKLDAGADGVSVRVTEGLMALTGGDDAQLAAAVAHEMAHNLLGHRQRLARSGKSNGQILATEIEADRLSIWLMANAGYDPAAALRFMERYGRKTGLGIFSAGTHLRWKNRQRVMQEEVNLLAQAIVKNGLRSPPLLARNVI